jgi:UDP-N-acetylglucosamine acyltransferase
MCRVGRCAIIGGVSGVVSDVIPYGMVVGDRARLGGLNVIGLKRRGFSHDEIHTMRKAYKMLFAANGEFSERVDQAAGEFAECGPVQEIVAFIRTASERNICLPRRAPEG